ncbi:hypothetical protein WMO19_05745 [Peptoniphilus sp. CLA-SR-H025]|uniref:SMODS and SLOG-associating 2TM effector domain-containing protein n=2 Tax=Peptoniphilaceae TaxID=1570339 RepID=A0ABV1CE51_9FIRM
MDSKLTDTTKENNFNDAEFIDNLLGKIDRYYTLSYKNDKNLEEMTSNDVENYVKTTYSNLKEEYSDKFLRDLTTFKIYRDNLKASLEYRSQTSNYFETLGIAISTTLITIVLSPKNKDWRAVELVLSIVIIAVILSLIMKFINFLWRRCKNSKLNKLKIVNESIHILEYKKEKLTQKLEDKNK